jgi:hypothetical protein
MSYDGLRSWLVQVDAMNKLRTLEGAGFKGLDEFTRRYRCLQAI